MIISHSKNFIFIHLEKCGGTSIEETIKPYLSKKDIKVGGLFPDVDQNELNYFEKYNFGKHATANDIKHNFKKEWDSMYKFTTVRDPQEMLISLYYYIENNFKEKKYDSFFELYHNSLNNKYPLDSFIKYVIENPFRSVSTFSSRLDNSVEIFDINNIDKNWNYILKKLKIKSNLKLNKLNKSIKPDTINLQKYTIDLIRDAFKIDYDTIPKITGYNWK
jgi:hypothetical protein